ncbi:MAG: sortase [Finegoldia sp.]|nr:sortase [Finegoldia sp.]
MKNKKISTFIFFLVFVISLGFLYFSFKYEKDTEAEAINFSLSLDEEEEEGKSEGTFSVKEAINKPLGVLYVPKIDLKIPIYRYDGEFSLRHGAAILTGDLLFEKDINTILTSHNGDVFRDLFTNIPKLENDDPFYIQNESGEIFSFKVIDKQEVLPEGEVDTFMVAEKGQRLVTLRTCVPLGINTRRLHVTGEFAGKVDKTAMESSVKTLSFFQKALIFIAILALLAMIAGLIRIKRARGKEN